MMLRSLRICSGLEVAQAREPSPPASATAMASSAVQGPPAIGARIMGISMRKSSIILRSGHIADRSFGKRDKLGVATADRRVKPSDDTLEYTLSMVLERQGSAMRSGFSIPRCRPKTCGFREPASGDVGTAGIGGAS